MLVEVISTEKSKAKPRTPTISFIESATLHLPKLSQHSMYQNENQHEMVVFDVKGSRVRGDRRLGKHSVSRSSKEVDSKASILRRETQKRSVAARKKQRAARLLNYFDRLFHKDALTQRLVIYLDFIKNISFSNDVKHGKEQGLAGNFKAFVGKGNNSSLIKNVVKHRWWWNIVESETGANLVWSQARQRKCIEALGTFPVSYRPGIKTAKKAGLDCEQAQNLSKIHVFDEFSQLWKKGKRFPKQLAEYPSAMHQLKLHNHLEFNWNLSNKKALFLNLMNYYRAKGEDPWKAIPLTFHLKGAEGPQWAQFEKAFMARQEGRSKKKKNFWIVKPGQNSNRGCGIEVHERLEDIKKFVEQREARGNKRTTIVQRYIQPFLYNRRKFDFRCYLLVTSVGGIKAYWYEEGYVRTVCKQFTLKNLSKLIHLTNDAVQKKSEDYGRFETGNKLSFQDFQKYLDGLGSKLSLQEDIVPKMIALAVDSVKATFTELDKKRRAFTFELFGLDYMLDANGETYLIEVNNNPCLELSAPILARIIPAVMEGVFKVLC